MQRREFARSLILGTGAVCTLTLPGMASATHVEDPSVSAVLARLEGPEGQLVWRNIEHCSSSACTAPRRVRLAIEALEFPVSLGSVAIDAMFATQGGLRPFRVAVFQPGTVSPVSKPFSFEVGNAGLAGFRIEHTASNNGRTAFAASALLGAARPVLAEGRYVLALAGNGSSIDLRTLDVPHQPNQPLLLRSGATPAFAYLAFAVQALAA